MIATFVITVDDIAFGVVFLLWIVFAVIASKGNK